MAKIDAKMENKSHRSSRFEISDSPSHIGRAVSPFDECQMNKAAKINWRISKKQNTTPVKRIRGGKQGLLGEISYRRAEDDVGEYESFNK